MTGRTGIEPDPPSLDHPAAHLLPVLAALVERGARIRYRTALNGFHPARDGWRCELLDPIDFDHVERQFALPPTIRLDRSNDRIDDTANHVMIVGPIPAGTVPGVTAAPGSPAPAPR